MIKNLKILLGVETKQAEKNIDKVGKGLKNVGTGGKIAQKGLGFMSNGFKKVGLAIKAAGIGLFIGLLSQLTGLFQSNQKITDAFSRIMLKLKPIFDAVGKALEFVVGVIEAMIDVVSDVIGSLFGFTSAANDSANALVEQRNKVKLLTAELGLLQLQYQKEAELMRQIRDDESLSIEERIAANFELGKVLAEQLEHEKGLAQESLRLAEMELALNKDNIDLQTALIEAKTKLAEIDERITGQRSEQLTNLNSLEREREAQQKEASAKREEQLKAEAEMLQELIDLQNEDIDVKKRAARTLNEQFDNAEKANQEQIDFLKKKKKEELAALEQSQKNAKKNIEIKKEELRNFEETNKQLEKSNQEKLDNFSKTAKLEMEKVGLQGGENFANLEELYEFQQKKSEQIGKIVKATAEKFGVDIEDLYSDSFTTSVQLMSARSQLNSQYFSQQEAFAEGLANIERITKASGEEVIAITDEQIEYTEESLNKNLAITDSFNADKQAIIDKYNKQIYETEQGAIDTKEILQKQADESLFLHFEETKDREIRLAEEKYDELIGKAQGNAEATAKLEKQKTDALEAIEQSYIDKQEQAKTEFYKYIEVEELNVREKELNALQTHLDKVLEIEGLTDQQRLEAEEEYIRQYDEVTDRHRSEDLQKEKENKRKMTDLALSSMHSIVDIAGLGAQKEIGELEKKFKNGAISEEKFNKEKNRIEEKQRKKEKKAALAQIAIDTGRQISSAYTAALSAAAAAGPGAPVVTPMLVAQMLAIVFAGVAQAKGALGVSGGGGGEGGVDDVGGVDDDMGAGAVPRINFGAAGNEQPPVQAFVVETDISNAQALQSELDLQSTL